MRHHSQRAPGGRTALRLATGGAALSAVVVVAAVAFAPSLGGAPDRVAASAASPAPSTPPAVRDDEPALFTVRYTARGPVDVATAARVEACLALPGVRSESKPSTPPVHGVSVTGSREAAAFAACVRALAGDGVTLTEHRPPALDTEADIAAFVEACASGRRATPVAGVVGMTQDEVLAPGVNSRVLGRDGVCNPGLPVPDPTIVDVVIADGVVVWAGHLEVWDDHAPAGSGAAPTPPPNSAPTPPPDPAGAEICAGSWGSGGCRDVGPVQARELAAALATGREVPADEGECLAPRSVAHSVTWRPESGLADPVVWTVPLAECLPMEVAGQQYALDQDARDVVARLWDTAGR